MNETINLLEHYLPSNDVLHGLRTALNPCFIDNTSPKSTLNELRQFLERMVYHLFTVSSMSEKGSMRERIDKLSSEGIIDHQITPYCHLWWQLSCLGSHFQQDESVVISWNEHLNFCRHAAGICLRWYVSKYPPLALSLQQRRLWLEDASTTLTTAYKEIQVCNESKLEERLMTDSILTLHGRPWVGKTSIGSYWVTKLCNQGYIPLVAHENSLITFRILSTISTEEPKNLRLATNAQKIHEIISSRLLHGDSFVIFLDDPFGHRSYNKRNPFMYLRLAEWIRLASHTYTLGKLKIVTTTPSEFLAKGREMVHENARVNPIARDNLSILDDKYRFEVDVALYTKEQLTTIIRHSAYHHHCKWSQDDTYIDMVAQEIQDERLGFNALHVLCRDYKRSSVNEFLDGVIRIARAANIQDEIKQSTNAIKVHLCAAFVGEALLEFYREFSFQTELTFTDLCLSSHHDFSLTVEETIALSDWLFEDNVATMRLSKLPVFSHPEVRFAVESLSQDEMKKVIQYIVTNITGLSTPYTGVKLMRWEATHLVCRMARFISTEQLQLIGDEFFFRAESRGGDPRNILWAIVGNWHYIQGTEIEPIAMGFLKNLSNNLKGYLRPFIWEATENWTHLNSDIKQLVIMTSSNENATGQIKATINEHNTITFLAAGVAQYIVLEENARAGCTISEKYLELINEIVNMLANNKKQNYLSRKGDGIFENPGASYSGKHVLRELIRWGRKRGALNDHNALLIQITNLLGS